MLDDENEHVKTLRRPWPETAPCCSAVIQCAHLTCGDGVTSDFPVMRHMANLDSVRTYEGTDEVHALVIGQALTAHRAFS